LTAKEIEKTNPKSDTQPLLFFDGDGLYVEVSHKSRHKLWRIRVWLDSKRKAYENRLANTRTLAYQ